MYKVLSTVVMIMVLGVGISLLTNTAFAQTNFGVGPGCSPIEGVDATTLVNGDFFTGKISCNGVTGLNPNATAANTTDDGDPYLDSLEACINDALVGFCSTINGNESGAYTISTIIPIGKNQCFFTLTFSDVSTCGASQCSDNVDNDGDLLVDFPADPQCADYNDNDESA